MSVLCSYVHTFGCIWVVCTRRNRIHSRDSPRTAGAPVKRSSDRRGAPSVRPTPATNRVGFCPPPTTGARSQAHVRKAANQVRSTLHAIMPSIDRQSVELHASVRPSLARSGRRERSVRPPSGAGTRRHEVRRMSNWWVGRASNHGPCELVSVELYLGSM